MKTIFFCIFKMTICEAKDGNYGDGFGNLITPPTNWITSACGKLNKITCMLFLVLSVVAVAWNPPHAFGAADNTAGMTAEMGDSVAVVRRLITQLEEVSSEVERLKTAHQVYVMRIDALRNNGGNSLVDGFRIRKLKKEAQELTDKIHRLSGQRENISQRLVAERAALRGALELAVERLDVQVSRAASGASDVWDTEFEERGRGSTRQHGEYWRQELASIQEILNDRFLWSSGVDGSVVGSSAVVAKAGAGALLTGVPPLTQVDNPDELREMADELKDAERSYLLQAELLQEQIKELRARIVLARLAVRLEKEEALFDESTRFSTMASLDTRRLGGGAGTGGRQDDAASGAGGRQDSEADEVIVGGDDVVGGNIPVPSDDGIASPEGGGDGYDSPDPGTGIGSDNGAGTDAASEVSLGVDSKDPVSFLLADQMEGMGNGDLHSRMEAMEQLRRALEERAQAMAAEQVRLRQRASQLDKSSR